MMSIYLNQINNAKIIIKEKINYFVVNPLLSSYKLFINYIYNKNKNINKNKKKLNIVASILKYFNLKKFLL